jgi:hypothetical protein
MLDPMATKRKLFFFVYSSESIEMYFLSITFQKEDSLFCQPGTEKSRYKKRTGLFKVDVSFWS